MIARLQKIKSYCCEDITKIENYEKAVNDKEQHWVCHHRNEITMNLRKKALKRKGLYYNRPASELIFLTNSEHSTLHAQGHYHSMYKHVDGEELRRLYSSHQMKNNELAKHFGISINCLYLKLKEFNIPTRLSLNKSVKVPLKKSHRSSVEKF